MAMTCNDEILYFFDELTLNDGDIANRTVIESGGSLIVNAGGTANSTSIQASKPDETIRELIVRGTANGVRNRGGSVEILDGGYACFITVSGSGIVAVKEGGTAAEVTVEEQGFLRLSAGGTATEITVENGGSLFLETGASVTAPLLQDGSTFGYDFNCSLLQEQNGEMVNVLKANESENYRIAAENTQTVGDGCVSRDAVLLSGGTQRVLSGGTVTGSRVEKGGSLIVETGGSAFDVIVEQETDISYDFGTTVRAKTASLGSLIFSTPESSFNYSVTTRQDVLEGYIAFGGFVLDGAVQNIESGGEASYMTVRSGGVQNVLEGGRANVTSVFGEMTVARGAVANYTEIKDGVMSVQSGGTANNVNITVGTTLNLEAGAVLGGITSISGQIHAEGTVTVNGVLNFNLIEPGFLHTGISPETVPYLLVDDITLFDGAAFRLSVSPEHPATGEYRLAGNAADFSDSITVVGSNDQEIYFELNLTDRSSFARNGIRYTLARNDAEELVLRVEAIPAEPDTESPLQLRKVSVNVYAGRAVTVSWDEGVDNVGTTGFEIRYAPENVSLENATLISVKGEECRAFLEDLAPGTYICQVRALDAAGNRGEWSTGQTFRISDSVEVDGGVISTELWGHDFLEELYTPPNPAAGNDVSGIYFADAEKRNLPEELLYCWGAASSNILTWTGWAANSPYHFRNEDEVFEYFINYWKNEGGMESDAFSWFFSGKGNSGTITVPAEGGNLFPQLNGTDVMFFTSKETETDTLLNTLTDYFDAGYGIAYAIYSSAGLAHAITGWGYEVDENGTTWLYYSDSDSDYWSGSSDRRDAVNRLSKTRTELRSDGRLYLSDYMIEGAYLGSFAALKQFDKLFLGEQETFQDARELEFCNGTALRGGNLDGADDSDYYCFSTALSSDLQITVSMAAADPALSGILLSIYNAGGDLLYSSSDYRTEQTLSFHTQAEATYYLLVQGNAFSSAGSTVPTINTYYVQISASPDAEEQKQAGISDSDDTWQKTVSGEGLAVLIPGDSAALESRDLFSVELDDGNQTEESNWVGPEDKKDLRALQFEQAGRYNFTISELESAARFSVYTLVNDKLKLVKRISVNAKTKEEKRGIFGLLLDADTPYFIEMESTNKTGTAYNVALDGEVFVRAGNSDDSELAAYLDPELTIATETPTDPAETVSLSLFGDNWVGFGDSKDFRILELADAGSYTFSISPLDAKASGTLSVWQVLDNGKKKKVFSLTGSSAKIKEKTNVLLEAGTYLVSFESKSWKKGFNTAYSVELAGTVYGKADNSDDQWQSALALEETSFSGGWVGYSDLQDWKSFTVAEDGVVSLELNGITDNYASLALYRRNIRGEEEKTPSKIASATAKDGIAEMEKFLSAGTYYLAVNASGYGKKSGTLYHLEIRLDKPETQGMLA